MTIKQRSLANMPRNTLKKQAGLGFLSVFSIICLCLFAGLFAFKVVPGYVDFMTIKKIVETAEQDESIMRAPKSKVLSHIDKAYRQNNLWDFKAKDTIIVGKGSKGNELGVDYEVRTNLVSNIFVVQHFQKGDLVRVVSDRD